MQWEKSRYAFGFCFNSALALMLTSAVMKKLGDVISAKKQQQANIKTKLK